jgi:aldehyde:ferredoxin oxidoreductase
MESKIPGGYTGKILRVNLSDKTIKEEAPDPKIYRKYLGGAGLVAYYCWTELQAGIDALSPQNILIFALGPATGYSLPGVSRMCIGGKSPLTGGITKSEVGGYWMAQFKRAGYDALIVEGKSEKPVYLWVQDGKTEIRDASHLWGKETLETQNLIRTELGDEKIEVAMIGPGGENQVRYACIMAGTHDAAARGGIGAVMGSKNLKAVATRGHLPMPAVADDEMVKNVRKQVTHPHPISEFGTGGPEVMMQVAEGDLPTRNYRDGDFVEAKNIHGGAFKDSGVRIGMEGCFACPLRCKKIIKFDEPYKHDPAYGGPEYESIAALGSAVGVSDMKGMLKANERCNAYSLDSISAGSTIAFAIECYERGLLTKKETGGLELKWGDHDMVLKLLDLIAHGQGFGKELGQGTIRMSQKIGKGSEAFAIQVKGLEPGMHEPRIASFLFLGFLLAPIGADHCVTNPDGLMANEMMFAPFHVMGWDRTPGKNEISPYKVGIFKDNQFLNILGDSALVCQFPGYNFLQTEQLIKGLTGWDTALPEMMKIAERVCTLMRMFNLREGFTEADDKLPERLYGPTTKGPLANIHIDRVAYEKARKYYYVLMGWDSHGVPLPEKIEELSIP